MPPMAVESMTRSMPAMPVVRTRIRGTLSATHIGALDTIMDTDKQEITLIDPSSKTFATGKMTDYTSAIGKGVPKMPPEVEQMMSGLEISPKKTNRTDVVQGIKVGEREINLSVKIPLPPMPAREGAGPGPSALEMRIVMHMWKALPSEIERVPALRELDAVMSNLSGKMGGLDMVQQLSAMFPFAGGSMKKLVEELSQDRGYPLRTEMQMSMPGIADMIAQASPGTGAVPGAEPKAPMLSMIMEITDLSTVPIDDAVFQVPKDYQSGSFADLMKKINK